MDMLAYAAAFLAGAVAVTAIVLIARGRTGRGSSQAAGDQGQAGSGDRPSVRPER